MTRLSEVRVGVLIQYVLSMVEWHFGMTNLTFVEGQLVKIEAKIYTYAYTLFEEENMAH